MEWAKGLKDRVERTATQLSTQATTAFTPPDEDSENNATGTTAAAFVPEEDGDPSSSSSAQGTLFLYQYIVRK